MIRHVAVESGDNTVKVVTTEVLDRLLNGLARVTVVRKVPRKYKISHDVTGGRTAKEVEH
jgi:hypothetical protein